MARDNKGNQEVYREIWCLLKKQELYRDTSREINTKCSTKETLGLYHSRFHYKVTISIEIWCYYTGSMW